MSKKDFIFSKTEFAVAAVCAVALFALFVHLDLYDSFYEYSRAHESWELDEIFLMFLVMSFVLLGMLARAYFRKVGKIGQIVRFSASSDVVEDLDKLINSIPVMISYIGTDLTYKFCNENFLQGLSLKREETLGRPVNEILDSVVFEEIQPYMSSALEGEVVDFDHKIIDKDGHDRHLHCVLHPDTDSNRQVRGVYSVVNDITDIVNLRLSLKAERNFNDRVVELSDTLVVALDKNGDIKLTNNALSRVSGYSQEELKGKNWWKLFYPKGRADPVINDLNVASDYGKKGIKDYVMPLTNKSGQTKMIAWTTVNIFDENGQEIEEFIAVGHDLTEERKRADDDKENHKMRALAMMSGGLAHEINNALQPVLGMADVLNSKLADSEDEKLRKNVDTLYKNAVHARNIVEQVLNFSRRDAKEHKVSGASKIVNDAIEYCRSTLPETVELQTLGFGEDDNILDDIPIKVDDTGMKQVMSNLLNNAADAMEQEGTVKVSLVPFDQLDDSKGDINPGKYALLAVADDGPGMDPDTLNSLFQPFFTTKKMGKGTGLGLATVYSIVNEWNGKIEVESDVGEGSTFKIYIPKSEEEIDQALKDDVIIYVPNVGKR